MHLLTHLIGTLAALVTLAALFSGAFFAVIGTWDDDIADLRRALNLTLVGYGLIVVHGVISQGAAFLPI